MVWLVQNCRSNKCLIPQTPEFPGGFASLAPYHGSALVPLGTLSGPQTPRLLTPPLTTHPGSAPELCVRINNKITPTFKSFVGVKQGDANLFKLFLNDLPEIFKNASGSVK